MSCARWGELGTWRRTATDLCESMYCPPVLPAVTKHSGRSCTTDGGDWRPAAWNQITAYTQTYHKHISHSISRIHTTYHMQRWHMRNDGCHDANTNHLLKSQIKSNQIARLRRLSAPRGDRPVAIRRGTQMLTHTFLFQCIAIMLQPMVASREEPGQGDRVDSAPHGRDTFVGVSRAELSPCPLSTVRHCSRAVSLTEVMARRP